jgi:hypothetical protein
VSAVIPPHVNGLVFEASLALMSVVYRSMSTAKTFVRTVDLASPRLMLCNPEVARGGAQPLYSIEVGVGKRGALPQFRPMQFFVLLPRSCSP